MSPSASTAATRCGCLPYPCPTPHPPTPALQCQVGQGLQVLHCCSHTALLTHRPCAAPFLQPAHLHCHMCSQQHLPRWLRDCPAGMHACTPLQPSISQWGLALVTHTRELKL